MEGKLEKVEAQKIKINIDEIVPELLEAIKYLAIYQTKIRDSRQKGNVYIPRLTQIEAISSMRIEGTQTTMSDVITNEIFPNDKKEEFIEFRNHVMAITRGSKMVKLDGFTHEHIKEIHKMMLTGIKKKNKNAPVGEYKISDNWIENSVKTKIYNPPSYTETIEYMDDLLKFMNSDEYHYHPLINAAIMHAQFESIHPFGDRNGRVGRMLVPLYLYKVNAIDVPLFYISEAFEQDKVQYYKNLTNSRTEGCYNLWIKFFLNKCIIQTKRHIRYFENIDKLYDATKNKIDNIIKSPNNDKILDLIFDNPQITIRFLADRLEMSVTQAGRYISKLVEAGILISDDKQRNVSYIFRDLIDLINGNV